MKSVKNQPIKLPPVVRYDWPFTCLRYYCCKKLATSIELASMENKKIFAVVMLEFNFSPSYIAERLYIGRSTVYKAKNEHEIMMGMYWYKARYEACKNYICNFPHNYNKRVIIDATREAEKRKLIEKAKANKILR